MVMVVCSSQTAVGDAGGEMLFVSLVTTFGNVRIVDMVLLLVTIRLALNSAVTWSGVLLLLLLLLLLLPLLLFGPILLSSFFSVRSTFLLERERR